MIDRCILTVSWSCLESADTWSSTRTFNKKLVRLLERFDLAGEEKPFLPERGEPPVVAEHHPEPHECLKIPHPAGALFDVRFDELEAPPVLLVARERVGDLLLDELRPVFPKKPGPQPRRFARDSFGPADKTALEERGPRVHVLRDRALALDDRLHGVAHLETDVPQELDEGLGDVFDEHRLPFAENEDIDVGERRELGAAVAADADDGDVDLARDRRRAPAGRARNTSPAIASTIAVYARTYDLPAGFSARRSRRFFLRRAM